MTPRRIGIFIAVVLAIWTAMHVYVFWRVWSVPWIASRLPLTQFISIATLLWASYPLARIAEARGLDRIGRVLEWIGSTWMGVLFLLMSLLLLVGIATVGGFAFRNVAPLLRGFAVIAAGTMSVIALIQALRPPVVTEHTVALRGLPPERDGLVIVHLSDLHLGVLLGRKWLHSVIVRVAQLKADVIVIVGDLIDGNAHHVRPLVPVLKELRAPLGIWAVTGNHEYYAGLERSLEVFAEAGFRVLRDQHEQVVPGLIIAGVDDLTARRWIDRSNHPIEAALANRPAGATILLSHSPWSAEQAAAGGCGLMLSGHTHNGQVWPFNFLVRLRYRLLTGRYDVQGMPVIVSRGVGTWGPRMRLWRRSEIIRITLTSKAP